MTAMWITLGEQYRAHYGTEYIMTRVHCGCYIQWAMLSILWHWMHCDTSALWLLHSLSNAVHIVALNALWHECIVFVRYSKQCWAHCGTECIMTWIRFVCYIRWAIPRSTLWHWMHYDVSALCFVIQGEQCHCVCGKRGERASLNTTLGTDHAA